MMHILIKKMLKVSQKLLKNFSKNKNFSVFQNPVLEKVNVGRGKCLRALQSEPSLNY